MPTGTRTVACSPGGVASLMYWGFRVTNGSQVGIGQLGDHIKPRRIGNDERVVG